MASGDLTDAEWALIAQHLPPEHGRPGRPSISNRRMLDGMLWLACEGARWRALPERFGKWNTIWRRFSRWSRDGVFERLFTALSRAGLAEERIQMLDSTVIRAHQHAAGAKGAMWLKLWGVLAGASRPSCTSGATAVVCLWPLR